MLVQLTRGKGISPEDFQRRLDVVRRANIRISVSLEETYVRAHSLEELHDVFTRLGERVVVRASHRPIDGAVLVVTVEEAE